MQVKRLKVYDTSESVVSGNRLIECFMGGYHPKIFNDQYFLNPNQYNSDWSVLMPVVLKIKQRVYDEGYDMFTIKHASYARIGEALYDADIEQVFISVVRWIAINFEIKDIEINKLDGGSKNIKFAYRTNDTDYKLKASAHAILRYQQRMKFNAPTDIVYQRLTRKELNESWEQNGDGFYYIGDNLSVVIENRQVKTCVRMLPERTYGLKVFSKIKRGYTPQNRHGKL